MNTILFFKSHLQILYWGDMITFRNYSNRAFNIKMEFLENGLLAFSWEGY